MQPSLILYIFSNPLTANIANETPLQKKRRLEQHAQLPINMRQMMIDSETANKIRDVVMDKHNLTLGQTEKTAYLIRLVLFGDLAIADFISRLAQELQIDRKLAQKIALDINQEIFQKVAPELREIQRKFSKSSDAPQPAPVPPEALPTLEESYEEKEDTYLEPVTEEDKKPKPLIEGNIVNLKSR